MAVGCVIRKGGGIAIEMRSLTKLTLNLLEIENMNLAELSGPFSHTEYPSVKHYETCHHLIIALIVKLKLKA